MRRIALTLTVCLFLTSFADAGVLVGAFAGGSGALDARAGGKFGSGAGIKDEGENGAVIAFLENGDKLTLTIEGSQDVSSLHAGARVIRLTPADNDTEEILATALGVVYVGSIYNFGLGAAAGSMQRIGDTAADYTPAEQDEAENVALPTGDMPHYGGFAFAATATSPTNPSDADDGGDINEASVFLPGEMSAGLFTSTALTQVAGVFGDAYRFEITALNDVYITGLVNDAFADNNEHQFNITASLTPGGGGGGVVPEPATFAVWGVLGALGLIAARRHNKKKAA